MRPSERIEQLAGSTDWGTDDVPLLDSLNDAEAWVSAIVRYLDEQHAAVEQMAEPVRQDVEPTIGYGALADRVCGIISWLADGHHVHALESLRELERDMRGMVAVPRKEHVRLLDVNDAAEELTSWNWLHLLDCGQHSDDVRKDVARLCKALAGVVEEPEP